LRVMNPQKSQIGLWSRPGGPLMDDFIGLHSRTHAALGTCLDCRAFGRLQLDRAERAHALFLVIDMQLDTL
jgi:hypothetical protein